MSQVLCCNAEIFLYFVGLYELTSISGKIMLR
jgi:hypothetical protein